MAAFQRAMVEITVSPWLARAIRDGISSGAADLGGRDLTARERRRLLDVVRQRGVSVQCSLARGNRLEMIAQALPMTCVLLRPCLRDIVDGLWREYRPTHYQLGGEAAAFAAWVGDRVAAGQHAVAYLAEILAYEVACAELLRREAAGGRTPSILVGFQHPPEALLEPLSRGELPPGNLPAGDYLARVSLVGHRFDVRRAGRLTRGSAGRRAASGGSVLFESEPDPSDYAQRTNATP